MKVLQFIRLLCLLGAIFIFPLSLYAMSTDLDNVKQLHLPARYLEGLREAQLKAKELHSIAFCMRAYPTEPFTDYQRQQLMETILRFERLTWDIKRELDKSLSDSDEILKHSLPPFDENGNLDRQNDVSFVYKSLFKNIPTKRTNHNRSTLEFIFNSSDKLHEMAYRSIVIYLSCFLKYVFCSEYPNPSNTPPLNPSIKELEQLRNEKIAVSRQLTNLSESLLASLGFDFTYSGVPISMLTSLHLSDQNPDSFRSTIRNYKTLKQLSAGHSREIYRWYSIKIERLKKVLCGFKAQISDVFDFLLNTEYLTNFTDVPVTPNGFLPRHPYITFEELLFKGFKFTPQAIAYPVDVLTRVQEHLKSIWPNGAGKNTHMTSMGMLKLFCEIMEERAHLSIETNKRFLPNSLQSIGERYLNTPLKTHEVKIRSGKRSLKVFTTYPFEINLTNSFGASEEYEMSVFVEKWKTLSPRLQQLLLSLQLIELIVTHNEMALYKAYKKQLERVFTLLKSPSDNCPELQNVQKLWVQESEYARQRNVDKIHLYTHILAPNCRFPDILGLMQQTSGAYIGVNSGLFFALNKNELVQYQSDRNLVNVIMRVLNLYSTLVPLPAPQTPWNPGEWSLYMNIVPDAPEAPSYSIHTNVEVSDKRDLATQITSSFLTRRFIPPSSPFLKIRPSTRNQPLTSEFLEAHRDSLTPPAPWDYVEQNLQSQDTSPMEDQLRAIFKAKARSVYVAPQTLSNSLLPNMSWAALSYYSASLPKSWVELDLYDGPEEDEYLRDHFDAFFQWYWKHKDEISKGRTPQVLPEDLET